MKDETPDCLLFFRMGDFYELFFDDAMVASAALDIALTHRGKHQGVDVPMCGVPVHSHDGYVARLIQKGYRVAICEQVEDSALAKKRGPKSVVERAVVRIVTAGTVTEDTLLEARTNNYLAALARVGADLGLAWADISTGVFEIRSLKPAEVSAVLAELDPGELLAADRDQSDGELALVLREWQPRLTVLPVSRFDSVNAHRRLLDHFQVATLAAFGDFSRAEIAAGGVLLDYIDLTQRGRRPRLSPPRRVDSAGHVHIDAASRRNLELVRSLSGDTEGSLLRVIDLTITGSGARLLHARLSAPLTDPRSINERLEEVAFFVNCEVVREDIRLALRRCPDIERSLSRLTLGRGGPRDLAAIRVGLALAMEIEAALLRPHPAAEPAGILGNATALGNHDALVRELSGALAQTLPLAARDGDFVAVGYTPELDAARALRDDSRQLIAALQATYARETGISSLKIRHNNVLGYFVEVSAKLAEKLTDDAGRQFILRQSMANAVRFTTSELADLELRIAKAADEALALELSIFDSLVAQVTGNGDRIAASARALAEIDVATALASLAVDKAYCRPELDLGNALQIVGGRHPVVEAAIERDGNSQFVPNDCLLMDGQKIWLVTGPNMAGKSTFLRQSALIVLLAQMGSFVPARSARIGIVDRVFSRVGAGDDLARGQSTFMVEMVETAAILNQASERALVILDEIGRGTATFDGLSIAWAVVEHLHNVNRCRALFATHYHELTALAATLGELACYSMRIREWQGDIVFLHEVVPGAANRSYGIHVGRLAGLPAAVLRRAEQVLRTLESGEAASVPSRLAEDLPLFAAAMRDPLRGHGVGASPIEEMLDGIEPDKLTPRAALDLIYALKERLADERASGSA